MIEAAPGVWLEEAELVESFIRASGPGGQKVNKTSSAVELRFDARRSLALSDEVAIRLLKLAGSRATKDGVIVIQADRHRTQELNREDARQRLFALIAKALETPKPRRATKPPRAAKEKRLGEKAKRSAIKAGRRAKGED